MSTIITLNNIIHNIATNTVSFTIASSPREESWYYKTAYMILASSCCPEFTGEELFVHGTQTAQDDDIIEVSNADFDKIKCAIAEYNNTITGYVSPEYVTCCNHLWLERKHCDCQQGVCHICSKKSAIEDMRMVEYNGKNYSICKEHRKTVVCPICETKHYFLVQHNNHNIEVCANCVNVQINMGIQHNYSYKPIPIFHDYRDKIVKYDYNTVLQNKRLYRKFWMGHEVEQQLPTEISRELLIGQMTNKLGDLIYCKSDSSIGHGTECVTHPFSWEFFKQQDWNGILSNRVVNYKGSTQTVGHHVHMNKNAFGRLHLYKFLKFHHTHKNWVEFIAKRPLTNYCVYTGGAKAKALELMGHNRYDFINVGENTIEWRAFASPLTIEEFKCHTEYLYAVFNWTQDTTEKDLTVHNLVRYIMKYPKEFPYLIAYITPELENPDIYSTNREPAPDSPRRGRARARNFSSNALTPVSYYCNDCECELRVEEAYIDDEGDAYCAGCYYEDECDEEGF